ncbi:MAG TPA: carbohydrate kinase family protein [Syntrophorhabdales bacterium]|nr:carbohydrate kinase family protein [Syntrophorhabdales bacterium]
MTTDVLGMGAVAMDLVLRCEELPGEDGFAFVHEERWLPGGSCSNVLVTLSSMGARCAVAAQIGDDSYGNGVRADLDRAGISTRYLLTKLGGTSLHTLVAVDSRGSRSIYANLGDAFLDLSESQVSREMLDGVKVFYTDMLAAKPALELARLCREMGIPTVFNLECSPTFMESCKVARDELEEMISLCHLFCVGREGLRGLTPMADERQAALHLNEKYAPKGGVVATLGEKGAFWSGNGETVSVPAFTIAAVDTTGAGDAFAGALIYARLLRQRDMGTSLAFANACGAIKCLQPGPRLKANEKEVEEFMEAHRNEHP